MTIGESLRSELLADATIAAAVGVRIYPVIAVAVDKDGPFPDQIVFRQMNEEIDEALGPGESKVLLRSTFEIVSTCDLRTEAASNAYDRAQSISDAVLDALHGFAGTLGGIGGIDVQFIRQVDRSDDFDFEVGLIVKVQTFEITWRV